MRNKIQELYTLEQLSGKNTCVHRLHPTVKLLTTVVFIIIVVSFDKYSFGKLIPYVFYPALMISLSETPYMMLLKRFFIALPFCLFAGISNFLFDRAEAFAINGISVSYGAVSFFVILFKAYLCVMAVLTLVSVTPFPALANSMRRLRLPYPFVVIFEMIYRYIGVLFEEAYSMYLAYSLRSASAKGVKMTDMGSFAGQLLLRSFDRADRVYSAMKCRGYAQNVLPRKEKKWTHSDFIFFTVTCFLCVMFRFAELNTLFTGF